MAEKIIDLNSLQEVNESSKELKQQNHKIKLSGLISPVSYPDNSTNPTEFYVFRRKVTPFNNEDFGKFCEFNVELIKKRRKNYV